MADNLPGHEQANRKRGWYMMTLVIVALAAAWSVWRATTGGNDDMCDATGIRAVGALNSLKVKTELWDTLTLPDLSLKYPAGWSDYTPNTTAVGSTLLTAESRRRIINSDPISGQTQSMPLYSFEVYRYMNHDKRLLSDYINANSATEDEMERIRDERDGFLGARQWIWERRNPSDFSMFNAYYDRGDSIVLLRAWLNLEDPTALEWKQARAEIEAIFDSVTLVTKPPKFEETGL